MHDDPSLQAAPRGVWLAPYLIDDARVVIAIDSKGRRVGSVSLLPGLSVSTAIELLNEVLNRVDPPLRLI